VGLSGGVSNNRSLRAAIAEVGRRHGVPAFAAEPRHTGDNAAMIAFAAWMDRARQLAATEVGIGMTFEPSLELAG
jgi:N6-L-threonylcarbamoyladenine synthase